jgi:uncharacterized protein with NRDE domain
VTQFLLSKDSPSAFLAAVSARARDYNGFNLIAGDGESLWYYGSRAGEAREIAPGIHGLSNHVLDEPWPKVIRGRHAMERALSHDDPAPALFEMLGDPQGVPDGELPDTGMSVEWERRLASPLITGADYGTRASTVVALARPGEARFEERTRDADGSVTHRAAFRLPETGDRPPFP